MDLEQKIKYEFFTKHNDEFTMYPQDPGKTLQNLIVNEKGKWVAEAIKFTLEYVDKNS